MCTLWFQSTWISFITHCPEWDCSAPFTGVCRLVHTRCGVLVVTPWGRELPAGLQSKHSGCAQLFRKGLVALFGSGQGFKLPSTSHGDSRSVGKLCCHKEPLKADSNAGFDINCSTGSGQSFAKILDISQGCQDQNTLLCVGMLTDFSLCMALFAETRAMGGLVTAGCCLQCLGTWPILFKLKALI